MITVYRGSSMKNRELILAGMSPGHLLREGPEPLAPLTAAERNTLVHVLSTLPEDASVGVTLLANGTIFRLEHPAKTASAPPELPLASGGEDCSWAAAERGAPVLLGDRSERIVRLCHVFAFLGYDATAVVTDEPESVLERMAASSPLVLVVGESSWLSSEKIVPVAASRRVGLVRLGRAHDRAPSGVPADAVLETPIEVQMIARTLDPVIARVRAARVASPEG
jgi:hypothetical protein